MSVLACQTDAKSWPEPLTWKPSRWVIPSGTAGKEAFYQPSDNTYFPWSDGPQNCPGKKFAEVEFVAVLAYLLKDHRLRIKQHEGESWALALERLSSTINDVNMGMLLRMKDADRVRLQYTRT